MPGRRRRVATARARRGDDAARSACSRASACDGGSDSSGVMPTSANSSNQSLDDVLAPWLGLARGIIGRRLRDARAHAEVGQWGDASSRLDELHESLLEDVHTPARQHSYGTRSGGNGDPLAPTSSTNRSASPTTRRRVCRPGEDRRARPLAATRSAIGGARVALRSTSLTVGDPSVRAAALTNWETTHRAAIYWRTSLDLSDAQVALHTRSGISWSSRSYGNGEPKGWEVLKGALAIPSATKGDMGSGKPGTCRRRSRAGRSPRPGTKTGGGKCAGDCSGKRPGGHY